MQNDPYRLLTVAACMDHFCTRLENIPIHRAAAILKDLGHASEAFWWVYRDKNKYRWKAKTLAKSGMAQWPAKSIQTIKFIGGPPHKRQLFHGTLLTLVVDRILRKVLDEGMNGLNGIVDIEEVYA